MNSLQIRYQTNELTHSPYAHAIEINLSITDTLKYSFELSYIDRETLTEQEVLEEGFSMDDDIKLEGELNNTWKLALKDLLTNTKKTYPTELADDQEYWQIDDGIDVFYPKNANKFKSLLDEFQQAVFEQNTIEKPLEIQIVRFNENKKIEWKLNGFFETRIVELSNNLGFSKKIEWANFNSILKNIFSGDYLYEKATNSIKKETGVHINLGDEYWFEVGKSLLIQPSKITAWIDDLSKN